VHFWTHGGILTKVTPEKPLVMGHEASGTIHAVGGAVTDLQPGDRVAVEPGYPCRRCGPCKTGRYNLCPAMKFAADPPDAHGTLCRVFRMPADFVYPIPDALSLQEAVLVEPLAVAVHAVRLAEVRPALNVLVQGAGTIGLLVAAVAKAYGATRVGVSDVSEVKVEFARGFLSMSGVTVMRPDNAEDAEAVAARFRGEMGLDTSRGVDVVVECTGVETAMQTGLYALGAGGVLVQVGMGKPLQALPLLDMFAKETVFKTAFRYAPRDYEIALDLLAEGKISVAPLISSTLPFEEAPEAWERTRRGEGIKNLIRGVQD
ncbi:NAD(P)-dependent alcohol dehydrogenase, partial [Aspergillus fijiensis CBS 313.89]